MCFKRSRLRGLEAPEKKTERLKLTLKPTWLVMSESHNKYLLNVFYARHYKENTVVGGTRQTSSLLSCNFYSTVEGVTKKINMECGKNSVRNR